MVQRNVIVAIVIICGASGCAGLMQPSNPNPEQTITSSSVAPQTVTTASNPVAEGLAVETLDNGKCNYLSLPGTEIVFAAVPTALQAQAYSSVYARASSSGMAISYQQLLGKHAKVLDDFVPGQYYMWRKFITDDCKILYFQWQVSDSDSDGYEDDQTSTQPTLKSQAATFHYYLLSDYTHAKALIGRYVWVNDVTMSTAASPYPNKSWIQESLKNTQRVRVLSVVTENYGSAYEAAIKLFVKTDSGKTGLMNYDSAFLYTSNPIVRGWPASIIEAIRNQNVIVGMTEYQATLAWGEPTTINTTEGESYKEEQWVYPNYNYLYFRDGVLTDIQTSN